jgi:hypothetical protein
MLPNIKEEESTSDDRCSSVLNRQATAVSKWKIPQKDRDAIIESLRVSSQYLQAAEARLNQHQRPQSLNQHQRPQRTMMPTPLLVDDCLLTAKSWPEKALQPKMITRVETMSTHSSSESDSSGDSDIATNMKRRKSISFDPMPIYLEDEYPDITNMKMKRRATMSPTTEVLLRFIEVEYPDITNVKMKRRATTSVTEDNRMKNDLNPLFSGLCLPTIDSPPRSQSLSVSAKEVVESKTTYEIEELDVDDSEVLSMWQSLHDE